MFRLGILRRVTRQPTKGSPLWSLNLETVCTSVHGCIRTHQSSGIRSGDSKWTRTWTEACTTDLCVYGGSRARDKRGVCWIFHKAEQTFSFRDIRPWTLRTGTGRFVKLIRPANARNFKFGIPPPVKTRSVAANFANGEKSYLETPVLFLRYVRMTLETVLLAECVDFECRWFYVLLQKQTRGTLGRKF